jgi:hypothetical protein
MNLAFAGVWLLKDAFAVHRHAPESLAAEGSRLAMTISASQ